MSVTLAAVVDVLADLYPPATAQSWDRVGLVTGDPEAPIRRVVLAVDPTTAVIDEARRLGADLLVTHHPLLLRGVHSVATTTAKGAGVTALIRADIALYVAHTNADVAADGVNEALARACGLTQTEALVIEGGQPMGRVGQLADAMPLGEFARRVATNVPIAPVGVRVSGPADAMVRRVAVAGGAGDGFFDAVRASGADVYVTADLRHHPALEARDEARGGRPYLIDAGHWASEATWLEPAAAALQARLGAAVEILVSEICTDPWSFVVLPTGAGGDGAPRPPAE